MPHIIVEYSDTLASSEDIPKLVSIVHHTLAEQDTVSVQAIKTRAIPVQYAIVGDSDSRDRMIHITLKLLPGREDVLKQIMAKALSDKVRSATHDDRISITVEVMEMHEPSYIK